MKADGESVKAFLGWCVIGAAGGAGVVSILTVGPFLLLLTLALIGLMFWRVELGWAMAGMLSGASVPAYVVAWLNRDGPGGVCHVTATSSSCVDEFDPWPILVVAVLLTLAGIALFLRRRRRA